MAKISQAVLDNMGYGHVFIFDQPNNQITGSEFFAFFGELYSNSQQVLTLGSQVSASLI